MKNLKNTFTMLIVVAFSLSIASCGGSDNDDTPAEEQPTTADYFLKAKINDVQFEALAPRVIAGKTADRITITAVLPDLRNFEISISDYPANPVGTYTIPATSGGTYLASLKFGEGAVSDAIFSAGSCCDLECVAGLRGTLIITAISTTEISGTFSFVGTQTSGTCPRTKKIITEGSFKSGITQ